MRSVVSGSSDAARTALASASRARPVACRVPVNSVRSSPLTATFVVWQGFGIPPVEAMAAGCVPIVIARGGQREIVRHGVDGFLWENLDELRRFTLQVTGDGALAHGLAARAMERSRDFGTAAFRRRLDQIITAI